MRQRGWPFFTLVLVTAVGCGRPAPPTAATPKAAPAVPSPAPQASRSGFDAYKDALKRASRELLPANAALQRQMQASAEEARQDPERGRTTLATAYRAFGEAYGKAATSLTDAHVPPGLERYHEVLLRGMRELSAASRDTGEGMASGSQARYRAGEQRMRRLQETFGKDLRAALAGSGYGMDANGNLVKQ